MTYTYPTVTDFQAYFTRDFPYGDTSAFVMQSDIQKAMDQAQFNFNPSLFSSQTQFNIGWFFLTAHYLVVDLQASAQGIAGSYSFLTASKSVGSVSESFDIPDRIKNNPEFAMIAKTRYGAKYLSLIFPLLSGQMFTVHGVTKP